jgi:probable rRNA maturation factor
MTGRSSRRPLRIDVSSGEGRSVPADGLARWLAQAAPASARGEVTVVLVGDRQIRSLNRRFRGMDRVTDVLAFPMDGAVPELGPLASGPRYLGDIVIATDRARRQARAEGHSLTTELRVLALHGLLHLLGYDHGRDAGQMERMEGRLRRKGGLPPTLIQRSRPAQNSR